MTLPANSWFGATGYGNAGYCVIHVAYGVEAVYQLSESARQRTAYFRNVTDDNFVVTIEFDSWDDYQAAASWFQGYAQQAADPNNTSVSAMAVIVPSMNFAQLGIPVTGVSFGDQVGEITYVMSIEFTGASDSVAPSDSAVKATNDFTNLSPSPTSYLDASQYFFPWSLPGTNPSASVSDTALYDAPIVPLNTKSTPSAS